MKKKAFIFACFMMVVANLAPGCSTQRDFGSVHGGAGAEASGGSNAGSENGDLAGSATVGDDGPMNSDGGINGEAGDSAGCGSPSDPKNCGGCGHDCTTLSNVAPGALVECRAGLCYVPPTACLAGFGHCSSRPDDGCEANLSDPSTCGSCTVQCSGVRALCAATEKGAQCSAACTGSAADVCVASCVDLKSDARNCGTCGHDCTALANVSPNAPGIECRSSVCYVPPTACVAGFGHCSSRADDGCETELKTPANCGACGKTCAAPSGLCSTAAASVGCSSSCATPTPDLCGVKCLDVKSNPSNCGTCGHDCSMLPNVKPGAIGIECRAGACYVPPTACAAGHAHCSTLADDGCEADLSSPQHCGTCSLLCSGATPLCSTQTQPAKCLPNCTGTAPNVCGTACVNVANDPDNCGSCGHSCSALPNVKHGAVAPAVQCVAGACVLQPAACVSGFGHCGSDPNSGCETDLTQPKTCGSCSNACTAPTGLCSTTSGAVCSSSCVSPNPDLCTSKCVNRANDPGNCGSCGHDCASLPKLKSGASVTCSSGSCLVPSGTGACQPGYGNCLPGGSANDTDGCETPLDTTSNCGACGKTCGSVSGGTVKCSSGSCVTQCSGGKQGCGTICCDPPGPNMKLTCPNDKCTSVCAGLTLACQDDAKTRPCSGWDFETNTDEGWSFDNHRAYINTISAATTKAFSTGKYSLGTTMSSGLAGWVTLSTTLCGLACADGVCTSADAALGQYRNLKASILMGDADGKPSPMPAACATPQACTVSLGWADHQSDPEDIQWGKWFTLDLPMTTQNVASIDVEFMVTSDANWNGTLYIDDISIH